MPETTDAPVTPAQLTAALDGLLHGPYTDALTAEAGDLAAGTTRYLAYAATHGGVTDPATISTLTASLVITIYRLPPTLNAISAWLNAETAAGRIPTTTAGPPPSSPTASEPPSLWRGRLSHVSAWSMGIYGQR